MRVVKSLKGLG